MRSSSTRSKSSAARARAAPPQLAPRADPRARARARLTPPTPTRPPPPPPPRSWSATAKLLQGRTANAVKNRYNLSRRTRQRAHRILSRLGSKSSGTTAPADGEPADRGHSRATSEAAGRAFAPPLVHAISGLRPPDQLYGRLAAAAPMLIQAAGCYVSPSGAFDGAARAQRPELGRLFSVPPVRPCVERTLSAQSNYNVLNTLVTATPLFRPGVVPGVPLEHAYAGHAAAPRGGNYAYHISAAHPLTPRQGHAPRPASFPSAAELAARLHAADHPLPADDSIVRGFLMELFRGTNGHVNLDAAADVMSALGFSDCAAK